MRTGADAAGATPADEEEEELEEFDGVLILEETFLAEDEGRLKMEISCLFAKKWEEACNNKGDAARGMPFLHRNDGNDKDKASSYECDLWIRRNRRRWNVSCCVSGQVL